MAGSLRIEDKRLNAAVWSVLALGSLALIAGSWTGTLPLARVEVLGFLTGAGCVWLVVRENVWNWPVGILNAGFFLYLFADKRLYADSALQALYIGFGFLGWFYWVRGGDYGTGLRIRHVDGVTIAVCAVLAIVGTAGLRRYLASVNDSAPFLDALTTVLSLVAQYLLTRKVIENWLVWIAVDVIYIPLYMSRGLPLTAMVYALFLVLCVAGYLTWRQRLAAQQRGVLGEAGSSDRQVLSAPSRP
jgi:nicotinamide mononucleotide transporter